MGITIRSKNKSIDMGYAGFNKLRTKVAELTADDIGEHYKKLHDSIFLMGDLRKSFFDKYNKKIQELSQKYNGEKDATLDFIYASDCEGKITAEQCKNIHEVIKNYDDSILYGYSGREDCATFKDFKELVKDCVDNGCDMEWW